MSHADIICERDDCWLHDKCFGRCFSPVVNESALQIMLAAGRWGDALVRYHQAGGSSSNPQRALGEACEDTHAELQSLVEKLAARAERSMTATMKPHIWLDSVDQIEFEPLDGSSDMWLVPWPNWLCQVDGDEICGGGSTPLQAYLFWLQSKRAEALIEVSRMERELKRLAP